MPPTLWTGRYLDGRSAATHQVAVDPTPEGLVITHADGTSVRWAYDQIRQTQGSYQGEQVRLEHGREPAAALVVLDQRFLTALRAQAPRLVSVIHDPSRRHLRLRLILLAAAMALVVLGVFYRWGIPGLASAVTPYVPTAWEQRLGEAVMAHLAPEKDRCIDPYRTAVIRSLLTRLTETVPNSPYGSIQLHVVNEPIVNAFAAPGGYVVVFRGLLEKTETPEQLAGVLAHELQHIYRRHTTRTILEQASSDLLLAAVSGDATGAAAIALDSARSLGALRYSRGHEEEADREGMTMLLAAGIDPKGMVEFVEIMSKDPEPDAGILRYLTTHPSHEDRIQILTGLAGDRLGSGQPLLPHLDWTFVRRVCQAAEQQRSDDAVADHPNPPSP